MTDKPNIIYIVAHDLGRMLQNIDYVPTFLEAIGTDIPADLQGQSFWSLLTGGDYTPKEMIFAESDLNDRPLRLKRL